MEIKIAIVTHVVCSLYVYVFEVFAGLHSEKRAHHIDYVDNRIYCVTGAVSFSHTIHP